MEAREAARDLERLRAAGRGAEQQGSALTGVMGKLAGVFAAMKIVDAAEALIKTQREFDKLNASLVTATGSVANAAQAFGALQAFAASTPYGLQEVTKAFIQLRNLGLTPSERALNSYGNTASAMGKSLNQMVEAVADAATGEFERLKEFGIKAKQNGDQVSLTFQGVTTNIANNAATIEKYLIGLGETKFAGGMELQAKTLDGAISNLGDTWDMTKLTFSQSGFGDGAMAGVLALSGALQDLQAIVRATGLAVSDEGKAVTESSFLHKALSTVFETVAVLGEQVMFVFRGLGREISGIAAQATALATGDFKAIGRIRDEMLEDSAEDRRMTDARVEKILWAAAVEKQVRENAASEKARDQRDDLAGYGIKQAAAGKSAEAIKKESEAYRSLVTPLREAAAANAYEIQTGVAMTTTQKAIISLNEDLRTKKITLTKEHEKEVRVLIESIGAQERWLKAAQQTKAAVAELADQRQSEFASAAAELATNERAVEVFGMTQAQIELLTVARLKDRVANAASLELTASDIAQTERLIAVKQKSADALTKGEALAYTKQLSEENKRFAADAITDERDRNAAILEIDADVWRKRIALAGEGTEAQRALQEQYQTWYQNQQHKPAVDEWRASVKKYDDVFRTGFADMLNHGKSGWKSFTTSLLTTFKTTVADQIYKMLAQPFVVKMVGSLLGVTGAGTAQAAGTALGVGGAGGAAGSLSLINMGKSIYEGFSTEFASVAGSLGSGLSAMGTAFGSEAVAAFGAGLQGGALGSATASAASGYAGTAAAGYGAAAAPFVAGAAGIAGGIYGGRAISGQYGSNSTVNTGTAIGAVIGSVVPVVGTALGALVGGLLGGVANRLFGMGEKKVVSTMIDGTLTPTGATGNNVDAWTQKGGLFRSNKSGTTSTALTGEQSASFSTAYKGILDVSKVLGATIGADTSALSTRVQKLSIDFKGLTTDAEKAGAITKFFEGVADTIALEMVPNLRSFQKEGESISVTMQRIVTNYASLDNVLASMGTTFGATGVSSITARESLIAAAGGLDKLASGASYFQQNFLTEAEQLAPVQKQLTEAMASLGLSSITTVDQFKQYTLGVDKTTESGAKLFAQMLGLAPAFKQITDATDALAQATKDAAAAAAQAAQEQAAALAQTNAGYQGQIDALLAARAGEAAVRELETRGLGASTTALYNRLAALNAENALASTNAGYQSQIDALQAAREGEVAVRALEIKGMAESTVALYDRLAGLKASIDAEKAAAEAIKKAQESAAEAIKKSQEAAATAMSSFGNALSDSMAKAHDAAKAFRALNDALLVGDSSTLNPEQKYLEAKRQFETADPANLAAAEKTFLDASKSWFGGSAGYAKDFAAVVALNSSMATKKDAEAAAIADFWKNFVASGGWGGVNGSHKDGLDFVPFDGYRAELHRGERVQTAASVRDGDAAAEQTNELLRELIDKLDASLGADKTQRGAVGVAVLEKLEAVASKLDDNKRAMARKEAA